MSAVGETRYSHCRCWDDGEPCCWCLDDSDEDNGPLPDCVFPTRECISDARDAEDAAQAHLREETMKKSELLAAAKTCECFMRPLSPERGWHHAVGCPNRPPGEWSEERKDEK